MSMRKPSLVTCGIKDEAADCNFIAYSVSALMRVQ